MKVYALPASVPAPTVDYRKFDLAQVEKDEADHKQRLKEWLQANGWPGPNTGEEVRIPHADGYARYMVADGSKMALIHLPYGDAWDSPLAHRMTKADVLKEIEHARSLAKLFNKGA